MSGRSVDDILGGIARDWISGGAGDDLLDGKDSDDILLGDKGNDIIYGWTGRDILFGGDGDDLLSGENDNDQLYGEAGADILSGGRGDDVLDGGEGRDVLKGDTDQDVLKGGAEDDRLSGGSGSDLLIGGTGEDVVNGGDDDDILYGDDYFVPVVLAASADHPASNNPLSTNLTSSADSSSGSAPATAFQDFRLRLEAEDFELRNYNTKKLSDASGGEVIATQGEGEAWNAFSGPTGVYDLVVGYYDKAKGAAEVTLSIQRQGSGNEDDDDTGQDDQTYTWKLEGATGAGTYQISEVALAPGDRILLTGDRDSQDFARLDYIDVITSGRDQSSETTGAHTELAYTFIGGTSGEGRITRVETESLQLSGGYTRLADPNASEDTVIAATGNTPGKATFTYTGQTGVFNLYANYFDSSAGNAQAEVFLNGVSLDRWEFNLNDDGTHEQTLGLAVTLNPGDVIQIQGEAGVTPKFNMDEGLVAHWTFDETSGNIAQDAKGIHDATLKNSSTDNSQWDSSPLGGALKLYQVGLNTHN